MKNVSLAYHKHQAPFPTYFLCFSKIMTQSCFLVIIYTLFCFGWSLLNRSFFFPCYLKIVVSKEIMSIMIICQPLKWSYYNLHQVQNANQHNHVTTGYTSYFTNHESLVVAIQVDFKTFGYWDMLIRASKNHSRFICCIFWN